MFSFFLGHHVADEGGSLNINANWALSKIKRNARTDFVACLLKYSTAYPFRWRRSYLCFFCNKSFRDPKDLRQHIRAHEIVKKSVSNEIINVDFFSAKCKICNEDVNSFHLFKNHLFSEHGRELDVTVDDGIFPFKLTKKFQCEICDQNFEHFLTLFKHMNTHYTNFICEFCGKGFATRQRKSNHVRLHIKGQFACRFCDESFPSFTERVTHTIKTHSNTNRYKCPICNDNFASYYSRNKHLSCMHNEKSTRYGCHLCEKEFGSSSHRTAHVKREHLREMNFMCTVCGKKFCGKSELKEHMIKHDGGSKVYNCDVCNKSYARAKTLREHKKTHMKDSNWKCLVCGRVFFQNSTLKRHMLVHAVSEEVEAVSQ